MGDTGDPRPLRVWVWRSDSVLKNYRTGLALVVAPEAAWSRLRRDHP
jgi:hypothetical protein